MPHTKYDNTSMKNDALPIVEILQLSETIQNTNAFADELALWEIDNNINIPEKEDEAPWPMRLNGLLVILITKGSLKLSIDYINYEVTPNNLLIIMPDHIAQFHSRSEDIQGKVIAISKAFIDSANPTKTPPPMLQYMYVRKNPCTQLDDTDSRILVDAFLYLKSKQEIKKHNYLRELVQNAVMAFLLEVGNIFRSKQEIIPPQLSRKEELFEQFLRLLFEHIRKEHRVSFYARKLFITSQYLSAVLKELSGKTANKWIEDTLLLEAKLLLKAPHATVQQVADTLHFSDQSTFGKFFKKHTGRAPSEYRKSK